MRKGIFLDRDGTVVQPRHYPRRPEDLILYEGIAPPLRALRAGGFALVVVTNQAGLARGYFSEDDLERMHASLRRDLSARGVELDGIYYCPHHVEGVVPSLAIRCACRKPAPGMLRRAAEELDLDLAASWMLGDILDDVEAGNSAGCRTILVDIGTESAPHSPQRTPSYVARDTRHALEIVRSLEGTGPPADLTYRPASWEGPHVLAG